MNKVILMGRLVADPEFSMTQSGIARCSIRIAVDRPGSRNNQTNGQNTPQSDFFRITCWRQTAEFVNRYFVKGKPILIEGRIQNDNYVDKNGVQQYRDQIVADNVSFLLSDPTRTSNGGYQNNNYNYQANNGYQNNSQPQQAPVPSAQQQKNVQLGDSNLSDFEEIIGDGDVPF